MSSAAMFLMFAAAASGADVTGTWTGHMAGRNGETYALFFQFKQDGPKLTGTVQGPQGDPIDISDGKMDGDKISFVISAAGGQIVIRHDGVVTGDSMELSSKSEQGDFPPGKLTLKKEK